MCTNLIRDTRGTRKVTVGGGVIRVYYDRIWYLIVEAEILFFVEKIKSARTCEWHIRPASPAAMVMVQRWRCSVSPHVHS